MLAQLKGKVSDKEHLSEQDPIDHLFHREKYILTSLVTWSCSFVCQFHISLDSVDENRSPATNPVDRYNIFI